MIAESEDKKQQFKIFVRINERFPEDFTVGLIYVNSEGRDIVLYRCNGPHGDFTDNFLEGKHHFGYHIHRVKSGGAAMMPELTDSFGTFRETLEFFFKRCSLSGGERYIKSLMRNTSPQLDLDYDK